MTTPDPHAARRQSNESCYSRMIELAEKCLALKAEFAELRGSRDYEDRARRIAIRREYPPTWAQLQDASADVTLTLEVGFPPPIDE